jgi:choline dehydrogenase-like flavoprotein
VVRTDVVIIGAGAAGITLARELAGTQVDVCVLESGGPTREPVYQDLAVGEAVGIPYWPLDDNRQRSVGGATNLWGGWCRPLDELDLEARDWVPASGWPITRESMTPYYRRADAICQLSSLDYETATWERELGARRIPLDERTVVTRMFKLSPPTRFGYTYGPELQRAANIRFIHHATALELETTPAGDAILGVRVGCLDGREFRVEPRRVVLAGGGLENARLLLLSNRDRPRGLGNDHDHVGRHFMEHLHFPFGQVRLRWPRRDVERLYSRWSRRAVARLFLTPVVQERYGLLNGNVMLDVRADPGGSRWRRVGRRGLQDRVGGIVARLVHTLEQAPDPSSRVMLGDDRDAFGQRRIRLDWRLRGMERETFAHMYCLVTGALEASGLGTVRAGSEETPGHEWPPTELQGQYGHHMGTTRMSSTARDGVVDPNCQVHGVANLFVAGSSVFRTAGAGTPTLTIVALAIRLADHLRATSA